jgi:hydroxypyruvate reductase
LELDGLEAVYALAADTDGIDGSEDNAGAFITPETLKQLGLAKAKAYLAANDSYGFFQEAGTLLNTGPTLTNVNDVRMILIAR